jgi:hypothetical protein
MKACVYFILGCVLLIMILTGCKQAYNPPSIHANLNYLVVDGIIISGQDATIVNLSRTQNLSDSIQSVLPETGAQVSVAGVNGDVYPLTEQSSGAYTASQLNLNNNEKYQLKIITSNGKEYLSDSIPVKITPAIDSVTWANNSTGVAIYVNTHDPQNNTRYYRWDFIETWEYRTKINSSFDWIGGQVVTRDSNDLIYYCWSSDNSTTLNIATSAKLAQDIINESPLTNIPSGSEKINNEYSILVKQYAITEDEFNYLQNIKTYTEQLGGLFDPQPSYIAGNIHCISVPAERVIGYISASTVTEQRIFINNTQVGPWDYTPYYQNFTCKQFLVPPDSMNYYFPSPGAAGPYVLLGQPDMGPGYIIITAECADCRTNGGTNIKPSYWP